MALNYHQQQPVSGTLLMFFEAETETVQTKTLIMISIKEQFKLCTHGRQPVGSVDVILSDLDVILFELTSRLIIPFS